MGRSKGVRCRSALFGLSILALMVQAGSSAHSARGAAPLAQNLASAFADTKAKLATGTEVADIMIFGDSLSVRDGSYTPYFRSLLQGQYGNAGHGYQGCSLWTGANFNAGWTNGQINADTPPHHSFDGLWANATSPTAGTGWFIANNDQVSLQYVAQPGGRTIQIEQPFGVAIDMLDCSAATTELRTWTRDYSGGSRQIWFRPLGTGPGLILGQDNATGDPGIRVHRAANGGWGVEQFLQRDWTFDAQLGAVAPDLIFIWLGQNDQNYTYAAYKVDMGLFVDRLQAGAPDAEIVLVGTYDSGSPNLVQLVDAMSDLAVERGLGFINMYAAAGDYSFFVQNGYLDDGLHFSHAGGQYIADLMFEVFESDGWSLYVPCEGDADGSGVIDLNDLGELLFLFGTSQPFSPVDLNHDGMIDLNDLSELLFAFGSVCE